MEKPDWPTRPQPTPIDSRRTGQQDSDAEAFWFVKMPRIVRRMARLMRDSDITQVYLAMAETARADGLCIATHAELSDLAGVSIRKVGTVLRALDRAGIITTDRRRSINIYTILGPAKLPSEEELAQLLVDTRSAQNAGDSARNDIVDSAQIDMQVGTDQQVTRHETTGDSANGADIRRSKTSKSKTKKTESSNDDAGDGEKPKREPTRIYQVAEWYANRIGGVIPGKGAREWADAKRLADTGITDDEMPRLFDWLAAQSWVQSLSLGLMASKFNEWRSAEIVANKPQRLVL